MNEISNWFLDQDYDKGVELYSKLPESNSRVLTSLKRRKNDRNMAVLISELRKFKNAEVPKKPKPVKKIVPPVPVKKSAPLQVEFERKDAIEQSASSYFKKINYAELPGELKLRFRELKDIFYDMCDLHFIWSDLPDESEKEALELQLRIEALDDQRDMIWKELEHWQKYKTMLPTEADEDFSKLPPNKLFLKKANLASNISKISKRIDGWEKKMEAEPNKQERLKISQQINRSQKKLHQHEINMRKIEELL